LEKKLEEDIQAKIKGLAILKKKLESGELPQFARNRIEVEYKKFRDELEKIFRSLGKTLDELDRLLEEEIKKLESR
jgi:hypothetical protein